MQPAKNRPAASTANLEAIDGIDLNLEGAAADKTRINGPKPPSYRLPYKHQVFAQRQPREPCFATQHPTCGIAAALLRHKASVNPASARGTGIPGAELLPTCPNRADLRFGE
ncbi:hypothetical protein [Afipia carboxidovorans]|uniref:hypothetical protein n=1 Tax=Afipia carboxidovorans TaxID=40137 RepID=UPI00139235CC|nr:hypothetical protein [Afipia carboxidovorans]